MSRPTCAASHPPASKSGSGGCGRGGGFTEKHGPRERQKLGRTTIETTIEIRRPAHDKREPAGQKFGRRAITTRDDYARY